MNTRHLTKDQLENHGRNPWTQACLKARRQFLRHLAKTHTPITDDAKQRTAQDREAR